MSMFFGGQRVAAANGAHYGGFDYLGDDSGDGFDWNDFADSGLKSLTSILNARAAAGAAKVGASPYAIASIANPGGGLTTTSPFGVSTGGSVPPGYTVVNGQLIPLASAGSVAGGIGAAGGSFIDGIARALGVPTSWLFIGGGVLLLFWFMPSPRRR
jgi:hypothetical protein